MANFYRLFWLSNQDGRFDENLFAEKAKLIQVKMIEIKLSQGAKPGHGGMLLGAKVSSKIAETRNVPVYRDVISPHKHSEFSTPGELLKFC